MLPFQRDWPAMPIRNLPLNSISQRFALCHRNVAPAGKPAQAKA